MSTTAEILQTRQNHHARMRTRMIRRLMIERGISCTVRTAAATAVTTVAVYSKLSAQRARDTLSDLAPDSIRIVVRRDV